MKKIILKSILLLFLLANAVLADPLPSWNDTAPKKAIIAFVEKVTKSDSRDFVPIEERIATFDNDGTLWSERPLPFQCAFIFDRVKAISSQHPQWQNTEPFASVIKGDINSAPVNINDANKDLIAMVLATQSGITTDEYEKAVTDWISVAKHPKTNKLYTEMTFQPMLELLTYLRANGFKIFIVSGGSSDFMRPWSEKVYGIPPEQVIGSSIKTKFEFQNGKPVIVGIPELNSMTAGNGKPLAIQSHIGRRPIASFGNSDNDLPMMQWTSAGSGVSFCLYVHHDDAKREWEYDRKFMDPFDKGLDEALVKGWTVVSMKDDWKIIHQFEKK